MTKWNKKTECQQNTGSYNHMTIETVTLRHVWCINLLCHRHLSTNLVFSVFPAPDSPETMMDWLNFRTFMSLYALSAETHTHTDRQEPITHLTTIITHSTVSFLCDVETISQSETTVMFRGQWEMWVLTAAWWTDWELQQQIIYELILNRS